MRAIVLPRLGGKTDRMLRWLGSDPRHVLIVHSARERERLVRLLAQDVDHTKDYRICTISEITRGGARGRWREPIFGIDELELVLVQIVLGPVDVVSFSGELETAPVEAHA